MSTFTKSVMVSGTNVLKIGVVLRWVKLSGQYYWDILPSQQMLSAIQHVAGDNFFSFSKTVNCWIGCTPQSNSCSIKLSLHLLLSYGSRQAGTEPDMHISHKPITLKKSIKDWLKSDKKTALKWKMWFLHFCVCQAVQVRWENKPPFDGLILK